MGIILRKEVVDHVSCDDPDALPGGLQLRVARNGHAIGKDDGERPDTLGRHGPGVLHGHLVHGSKVHASNWDLDSIGAQELH